MSRCRILSSIFHFQDLISCAEILLFEKDNGNTDKMQEELDKVNSKLDDIKSKFSSLFNKDEETNNDNAES